MAAYIGTDSEDPGPGLFGYGMPAAFFGMGRRSIVRTHGVRDE